MRGSQSKHSLLSFWCFFVLILRPRVKCSMNKMNTPFVHDVFPGRASVPGVCCGRGRGDDADQGGAPRRQPPELPYNGLTQAAVRMDLGLIRAHHVLYEVKYIHPVSFRPCTAVPSLRAHELPYSGMAWYSMVSLQWLHPSCGTQSSIKQWFKHLHDRIWIRDVFWLPHHRCWDPIRIATKRLQSRRCAVLIYRYIYVYTYLSTFVSCVLGARVSEDDSTSPDSSMMQEDEDEDTNLFSPTKLMSPISLAPSSSKLRSRQSSQGRISRLSSRQNSFALSASSRQNSFNDAI